MSRDVFKDVPLAALFPQLPTAEVESLQCSARRVDAARVRDSVPEWQWAPTHAVFPGPGPGSAVILLAETNEHADSSDHLAFHLDVFWTDEGRLSVSAAVNVACWCETDHATHYVDDLTLLVKGDTSLGQAFQECAEQLISWLENPREPDYWRERAVLPLRSTCWLPGSKGGLRPIGSVPGCRRADGR
jgi:hypothetical protein